MDLLERMNQSIDYIENNLTGEIDYERAAQIAFCSVYQFQRMFSFITDVTLSEYIRRRRLTLTAFELQNNDCKVIDVAMKYGYESPEAFARAFQAMHQITPTQARSMGATLKAYPRISFQITIKGVATMNYRIEKKEAYTVYGIGRVFDSKNDKHLKELPEFWTEAQRDGSFEKLEKSTGIDMSKLTGGMCLINGLCDYKTTGGTTFPYMLYTEKTPESNADGYEVVSIPAATWAVFQSARYDDSDVSKVCQELYRRIYSEWLPTSSYQMISGFDHEVYYWSRNEKSYLEVWIRVEPK